MQHLSVNPGPIVLKIFPLWKTGQLGSAISVRGLCGDWQNVMHVSGLLQKLRQSTRSKVSVDSRATASLARQYLQQSEWQYVPNYPSERIGHIVALG